MAYYPYLEIFNKLIELSKKLGYPTFDYLPDDEQGYPFVFVGTQENVDKYTKSRVLGRTSIQIDVYGSRRQRETVMEMLDELLKAYHLNNSTEHFQFYVINSNSKIISDTSTDIPLWHGILEVEIKYL